MATRCTQTEKYRRLQQIETWLADGYTRADILRLVGNEGWGIARSMVDSYIAAVGRKWKKEYMDSKNSQVEVALKKRERLYLRALKKDDLRTALAVEDSISKIKGILVDNVDITSQGRAIVNIGFVGEEKEAQ